MEHPCKQCGSETGNKKFCSRACANKYYSLHPEECGPANPRWRSASGEATARRKMHYLNRIRQSNVVLSW